MELSSFDSHYNQWGAWSVRTPALSLAPPPSSFPSSHAPLTNGMNGRLGPPPASPRPLPLLRGARAHTFSSRQRSVPSPNVPAHWGLGQVRDRLGSRSPTQIPHPLGRWNWRCKHWWPNSRSCRMRRYVRAIITRLYAVFSTTRTYAWIYMCAVRVCVCVCVCWID